MQAHRMRAVVDANGELRIGSVPFEAGDEVEVIVLRLRGSDARATRYPLRGLPVRYEDPTEPVAFGGDDNPVIPPAP